VRLIDPLDPPKENELLQRFYTHRATFEQLRDMLQADTRLRRVASWGVETRDPFFLGYPTEANFPIQRFQLYLKLLKEVEGGVALRNLGEPSDPGVTLWGWGWAGNSKHIGLCWLDPAPTNIIPTLDGYRYRGPYEGRRNAYRHIDQNWYFWTDL
jgi:hypothetical protein